VVRGVLSEGRQERKGRQGRCSSAPLAPLSLLAPLNSRAPAGDTAMRLARKPCVSCTMPDRFRSRSGFTLLEVLIALVILGIGILGLAGSTALVSRLVGDGSRLTLASTIATSRLERLRSLGCNAPTAGSALTRGIEERWTVAPLGAFPSRASEAQLSVTYRLRPFHAPDSARTQHFRGAIPCA
jgi:prepilin-type N-terminal cleavage/methylation domain-containing protein